MDQKTIELYEKLKNETKENYWPMMKIERIMKDGIIFKVHYQTNYRETYEAYKASGTKDEYAEWYKCLAFAVYGYGNWSNNDRKRKGLSLIRKNKIA